MAFDQASVAAEDGYVELAFHACNAQLKRAPVRVGNDLHIHLITVIFSYSNAVVNKYFQ